MIDDKELEKLALAECDKHRDECGMIEVTYAEMFIHGYRASEAKVEWPTQEEMTEFYVDFRDDDGFDSEPSVADTVAWLRSKVEKGAKS
jgi:hypothetical protein